jgi:hypothetical protein
LRAQSAKSRIELFPNLDKQSLLPDKESFGKPDRANSTAVTGAGAEAYSDMSYTEDTTRVVSKASRSSPALSKRDQVQDTTYVVSEARGSSSVVNEKAQDRDTTYVVSEAGMPVPAIGENDPSGSPTRETNTERVTYSSLRFEKTSRIFTSLGLDYRHELAEWLSQSWVVDVMFEYYDAFLYSQPLLDEATVKPGGQLKWSDAGRSPCK